ncbi:Uma2 family endonuclease [Candidatus Thiosymbion oneisti]|uniref:Uma2 family endonuclease n=1 Tax=Candidatus Thiosymbion oneisti TaxID=589554 RepID=UPI000ACA56CE|nr:Uma2 family endonuclease [Candidatus Thiosymbion oneisti]
MTNTAEQAKLGVDDYLAGEEIAPLKHEYVAGEVFAMAGAGEAHVTVALNLASMLRNHVRGGPCRVYISDMKVRVEQADAFYYPDVFVTCDPADGREKRFKRNPILIVEVLSDSTAAFDRGAKFAHYRQLDSLLEYVLIEPERPLVDIFRRNAEGGWVLHPVAEGGELVFAAIDFRCPVAAVYEDVALG